MINFNNIKKIVIKIGTSSLTDNFGFIDSNKIKLLTDTIIDLKKSEKDIIIVSSGAVGAGMSKLGFSSRPSDIRNIQACASVGQCELIKVYDSFFKNQDIIISQILLTRYVTDNYITKTNVINTFNKLLEYGVIPVVNENDTISTEELEFGDNDTLSAIVSALIKADLLVILSDIDGLYDKDPNINNDAKLISKITSIDEKIRNLAGDNLSELGKGGMITKIKAAEIAMKNSIPMFILNSNKPNLIKQIFENKPVGTLFYNKRS